jgi:hypothetical protein
VKLKTMVDDQEKLHQNLSVLRAAFNEDQLWSVRFKDLELDYSSLQQKYDAELQSSEETRVEWEKKAT